jgi:glutaconate CoA-transferase subunit B
VGLPRGGPSAVITTKCVLRFDTPSGQAFVATLHPGVTADDVKANTGWDLKIASDVKTTPEPAPEELQAIREYDREGFWTR